MKKLDFLKVCENHAVNPGAMKRQLQEDDINRKDASLYEVLRCMMINYPDLAFCRQNDYENEVEYFDKHAPSRLIDAMLKAEKEPL